MARFRPSVRFRLTLLYGGLFLLAGAILLSVNYFLVRQSLLTGPIEERVRVRGVFDDIDIDPSLEPFLRRFSISGEEALRDTVQEAREEFVADALADLVEQSLLALLITALLAIGLGWVVAGRVLRPITDITETARRLSKENLHERLGLQGPDDELQELADTLDDMLARLESAFESQRRFVSNASHELLTPLSVMRAELDVTRADPTATIDDYRVMADTVEAATVRSEHLIRRLLGLAQSDRGVIAESEIDLARVCDEIVGRLAPFARSADVTVQTALGAAVVSGDRVLLELLVSNLFENAILHNEPGGSAYVQTRSLADGVHLRVRNGGPHLDPNQTQSLFEPFRSSSRDRLAGRPGVGLGLSIVRSTAEAHNASIELDALPGGGLEVVVSFPRQGSPPQV